MAEWTMSPNLLFLTSREAGGCGGLATAGSHWESNALPQIPIQLLGTGPRLLTGPHPPVFLINFSLLTFNF